MQNINSYFCVIFTDNVFRMYTPEGNSFDRHLLYVTKPYITFKVRARESVNIMLMPDPQGTWWIDGYEIIIGSFSNTKIGD